MPSPPMVIERDPLRAPAALDMKTLIEESGADRASIMWAHVGSEELHPHVLVDTASGQPSAPISRDLVTRGKATAVTSRLRTDRVMDKKRGANFLGTAHERDWFIVLEREGSRVEFGPQLGYTLERIWVRWVRLMAAGSVPYKGPHPAALLEEAEEVEESGEFEAAIKLYAAIEEAALAWGDCSALIRSFLNTGRTYRKMGDWDRSKSAYETAADLSAGASMQGLGARSLLGIANLHRLKGNLPLARQTYELGLEQAVEAGDDHCVGLCEHGLSYMELSTGDPELGIAHGWRAYLAYPEQQDRVRVLSLLGNGWMKVGHLGAAKAAYEIMAKLTDSAEMHALALDALGQVAARTGNEEGFRVASALVDNKGTEELSQNTYGQILYHRGESLLRLGHRQEARLAFEKAVRFLSAKRLGVLLHQVETLAASLAPEPLPETISLRGPAARVKKALGDERRQLLIPA